MKGWKEEQAKTRQLYQKFRESPEAQKVVDTTNVVEFLNTQPKGVSGVTGVSDVARQNAVNLGIAVARKDGTLAPAPSATLGALEDFRSSVNAIGAQSPNDKRIAAVIKREVDTIGDPIAGELMRDMRGQRRIQASKYENRAIISKLLNNKRGTDDAMIPIEDVFKKTIIDARPSEIQHIKRVLLTTGGDEGKAVWNDIRGTTIAYIRDNAEVGLGADNMPVVSSARLNKTINMLDKNGKLDLVLGKQQADQIRNLNEVLKYIQTTPPLTSINNSGTARTIMAALAETGVMGSVTGFGAPVITGLKLLKSSIKDKQIKARIDKALNYKPSQNTF
jgi:hypothetical protein